MSAPQHVLSDALSDAIDGRTIVGAVFTTFRFDPEFFELEILPILFDAPFSHVPKVRRVQLEGCLRECGEVAVYYDRAGLVGDARSAALDFRRIDVRRTGIFHPKLVFVLVEHPPEDEGEEPTRSLVVAALSANLTRAGWWENVEAGHVEVIEAGGRGNNRYTYRRDLLEALDILARTADAGDHGGPLEEIRRFVRDEAPRHEAGVASRAGRFYTRLFVGQQPLGEWLRSLGLGRRQWNLEVVSPYFDGDGAGALRELIDATRPRSVRVFLPTEADGTPAVTERQFENVAEIAEWARLPDTITRPGSRKALKGAAPRRVHAKLYRFWKRDEGEVALVGSVNLTRPAHSRARAGNLEAAFLVSPPEREPSDQWWLTSIDAPPEEFAERSPTEGDEAERIGLNLSLRYDWHRRVLEYRAGEDQRGVLEIQTIAGEPLFRIQDPREGDWRPCGDQAADAVRGLLTSTSFVVAHWPGHDRDYEWRVLVREEGMTHKPSLLADLTPEEILQYWSLLSPAQQQAFLLDRLESDESLPGLRPGSRLGPRRDTVFDRFAGIFHAFEQLRAWIDEKLEEESEAEVTARLFGRKYDSLPVLLDKVLEREDGDPVIRYVTFLSARQVAEHVEDTRPDYWRAYPTDVAQLYALLARIDKIREALPLDDPDREAFLGWYEEMFTAHASTLEALGA